MPSDCLYELTSELRALGGGRVWSLMISLFGDLAQGKGDVIEGPLLSEIMATLDIKPEAVRVALHRLRKEGWIRSQKVGRISHHSLTAQGRTESVAASPRIYSAPDDLPEEWQLVVVETPDFAFGSAAFVQVLPRVFVGPATAEPPRDSIALSGASVPDWLRDAVAPSQQLETYAQLHATLVSLASELPHTGMLSALDIAVLRCLIVHNWRRLVLKHPVMPSALIRRDAPNYKCHVVVADLLARFPRPSLRDVVQEKVAR